MCVISVCKQTELCLLLVVPGALADKFPPPRILRNHVPCKVVNNRVKRFSGN